MKQYKQNPFSLSYIIFFNGFRGLNIVKLFLKKKINFEIIITSKNLNLRVIKELEKIKINYTLVNNLKNLREKLKKKFDIFLVAGFPHIFDEELLKFPKYGSINLHAGPLPKYRGGSPLNWQIINNEKKIGISIIKLNKKIDGGKILIKKFFKLKKTSNIKYAHTKANALFEQNIFKSIKNLLSKKYIKKKGKENYYKQRNEKDNEVDLSTMTAKDVVNLARALYPLYKPPFIRKDGKKIFFKKVYIEKKYLKKNYKYIFKCKQKYIGIKQKDILQFLNK